MSVRGWSQASQVTTPRGAWSAVAQRRKGVPARASDMQNVRIQYGVARSRPGTNYVAFAADRVTGIIFNWITPSEDNLVLYQDGDQIKSLRQAGNNPYSQVTPIYTGADLAMTRAPSFADLDVWTYFCGYSTTGVGTFQARVFDGTNVDIAFRGPVTLTAASAVDGGVGVCTEGTHFIGFVYQNRTGFAGMPTIQVLGVPISVTLGAALRKINVSVTLPPLDDGGTDANGGNQAVLFLIMTRADNPNTFYFMPTDANTGAIGEGNVPLDTVTTLNFVVNLSDEDIANELAGDTATDNFSLLTQDAAGVGPFLPSFVAAYGNRMCYCTGTTLYASDINNPQQIAADRNAVRMPNQRVISAAFQLPGNTNLYLTGDRWLAYTTDNGDIPATWPPPVSVSSALGSPFPSCVCARTGGNYAWLVTEAGPYKFDGAFDEMPLTYLTSGYDESGAAIGWNRVNWMAAYSIVIVDDVNDLKLYIAVPLDGSTEPTHLFVIDYRQGKTFDTVDISIDPLGGSPTFSSLGVVKNVNTGLSNVWIGPSQNGIFVKFDQSTVNDETVGAVQHAINSYWESGIIRNGQINSPMVRVGSMNVWARGNAPLDAGGNATFLPTIYGPDRQQSVTFPILTTQGVQAALTARPGLQYMSKFDIRQIEQFTVRFGLNVLDGWWELSGFVPFEKSDLYNR